MIARACTKCAAIAVAGTNRCENHPAGKRSGRPHRRNSQHVIANAVLCGLCGQPARADDPFERGHKLALADGGSNDASNYEAQHRSCNRRAAAAATNAGAAT